MKIGIITSPFGPIPPNALGAVEKRWYYIAQYFVKQNHEVTFYSKKDEGYANEKLLKIQPIKGYKRTGNIYLDIILDLIYTIKAYKKLDSCDILIQNTFWSPIIAQFFKKKFCKTIYNVARTPRKHFVLYNSVDQFSCVSHPVQKELNKYIKNKSKGITVHNPIDSDIFKFSQREIPQIGRPIIIGYHGRVHPEKGLDILCKAVENVSKKYKLKLKIIGPYEKTQGGGGQTYVDQLKNLCPHVDLEFVGGVSSQSKLNSLLQTCHLYCYPSVASGETFGVSPVEAMSTGLPVIVSDLECFKDFISHEKTGYIFNHRSENADSELSNIIEDIISHYDKASEIGRNAFLEAKKFTVENIANKYLYNFHKLLANSK